MALSRPVTKAIEACETFIEDKSDALALPREAARFAYALARAAKATRGLEIGTSYGYSGLWIGAAIQSNGGTLVTIDKELNKTTVAASYFADAGLTGTVRPVTGTGIAVIADLDGPFDFVLNDADKNNCRAYVEALLPKLTQAAIILTDNTTSHAEELVGFVEWARGHDALLSLHVPIGNGMEMSVLG